MTGQIIVSYFGRESAFRADDLIVAAIERVVRERLAEGRTMFLSATALVESGREHATLVLTPQTFVMFTYTDLGGANPDTDPKLTHTIDLLRRHIDDHGGISLDENDLPVDPT